MLAPRLPTKAENKQYPGYSLIWVDVNDIRTIKALKMIGYKIVKYKGKPVYEN